ncbi:MAG: Gfo/Idh/MocA family oxidoreductase [Planctomycetota bacterium]|nr:Gfo/Idh/MocA family oxidoreductase [Planctomycetota bacterium]
MSKTKRRTFIRNSVAAGTATLALPRFSIGEAGESPNSKLNLAFIGCAGRGARSLNSCKSENYVALCDVDEAHAAKSFKQFPDARRFQDFRVMFDKMEKEIDAVVVSTPDHTHFAATMEAMRRGKHVYVEKPLTHDIWQARTLRKAKHHYKLVTQMGNQAHATNGIRNAVEWSRAGLIGEIKEVQVAHSGPNFGSKFFTNPETMPPKADEIPETMDWDLWLGPLSPRDYSPEYAPHSWRSFWDMGGGMLGDWGCHTVDAPVWALDLGLPGKVEVVECAKAPVGVIPAHSVLKFHFPGKDGKPPVVMTWYDGMKNEGTKPPAAPDYGYKKLGGGAILMGDKGCIVTPGHPRNATIYPRTYFRDIKDQLPEQSIPRVPDSSPYKEWFRAIKGDGPEPGSNFDYSAHLTEIVLLGVLAQRTGKSFEWDAEKCQSGDPEIDVFIKQPVRKGWEYGEELWKEG